MRKDEIPKLAEQRLGDLLDEPGSIIYSSHETLMPGTVYLMGFNPGGVGGFPLRKSIESMLSNHENAYIDELWDNKRGPLNRGEAFLQKQIRWLLHALGLNTREVCASNLIFFQSKEAKDIDYKLADRCWPIHEAILNIVKPKLILVFGNSIVSPYAFIHDMYGGQEDRLPSGHGNWSAKGFSTNISGRAVYVAGIPHLSRYKIMGKTDVVDWLRKMLYAQ